MSNELKPCPFCGKPPIIYELQCGWYIDCDSEDDCSHHPSQQEGVHMKDNAIKDWNSRITLTPPKGMQFVSEVAISYLFDNHPEAYNGFYERLDSTD